MKITAEPRSDQWNADDFTSGPRTFTVAGVKEGAAEQKYDIQLVEGEGRVWRPPLTMLRVLLSAWGDEASAWAGHRVTLYQDPTVRFGKDTVGGIRISHLSHIDKPLNLKITTTRGRRAPYSVQPLPAEATPAAVPEGKTPHEWRRLADAADGDLPTLQAMYADAQTRGADNETLAYIRNSANPKSKES